MINFDHRSGQHVDIDGARIYVETRGSESDTPLVFLHGGMGHMEDFNAMLPLLQGRFRVIGIDSRGHGKSTLGREGLSYARLSADVERITSHLKLGVFNLIGFSDGGITALRLAARSRSIKKLVVIGSPWQLSADDPSYKIFQAVTPESWHKKFPQTRPAYEALNPEPDFDRWVKASVAMWTDLGASGHPGESVRQITSDLLVVRGDEDHLVSRRRAFELAEQVRNAKLLSIPFAGHEAHKDQTELLMLSVNKFLEDH